MKEPEQRERKRTGYGEKKEKEKKLRKLQYTRTMDTNVHGWKLVRRKNFFFSWTTKRRRKCPQ